MEYEIQPIVPPVQTISQDTAMHSASPKIVKIAVFALLGLVVIIGAVSVGIQIGKKQAINQQSIAAQVISPNAQTTITPTEVVIDSTPPVAPIIDTTSGWNTYASPEIAEYVTPFELSYPPTWTIQQKLFSDEPKSLIVTLTNSLNETITIQQAVGGAGSCIYFDDPDYTSFDGMGSFYSSYIQLNTPAEWRISVNKDTTITSRTVCEKNSHRYVGSTQIGWISVDLKSEASLQEVKTILETAVFKPTANYKSLFD